MASNVIKLALLLLACLPLRAEVKTEVLWRFGEDGYRYLVLPFDSSGHQRSIGAWLADPGFTVTSALVETTNAPTGSTAFYQMDLGTFWQGCWMHAWTPPVDNVGVECWIRADDTNISPTHIIGTAWATNGISLALNSGGQLVGKVNDTAFGTPQNLVSGQWVHGAVVRAAGTATFYVNGVASGTTTATPEPYGGIKLGESFYGAVDEGRIFSFDAGKFSTTNLLSNPEAPQILGFPWSSQMQSGTNNAAAAGENVTFHIAASGAAPLGYYWYGPDGLAGTAATLTVSNLSAADSGSYYVAVSNALGMATSAVATLTVETLRTPAQSSQPGAAQLGMMDRKYGAFLHFGINTFLNEEWSDGAASATAYAPTALDCEQWAQTVWLAGMKYVVLTAKHHDGFCLWPSAFTSYSVASGGNTNDVVKALARACAKYNLRLGIYYSLWDRHEATYTNNFYPGYFSFMTNQLTELLTNYGPVCEVWFDGGWESARPASDWRMPEIYDLVQRLQPGCLVGANLNVGSDASPEFGVTAAEMTNGAPLVMFPNDFRTCDSMTPAETDAKLFRNPNLPGSRYYLPFEFSYTASYRGSGSGWFYKTNDWQPRSLAILEGYYASATAQSNAMLLNLAPGRDGRITAGESNAAVQMGAALGLPRVTLPVWSVRIGGQRARRVQ